MAKSRATKKKRGTPVQRRSTRAPAPPRFVGRDPSPVLDRYPPKDPSTAPRAPPVPLTSPPAPPGAAPPPPSGPLSAPGGPSQPLITLDRPFDIDEFSTLLGETTIRMTVPRDALPEVLRRVTEFMGFGIYVYSITVRPAPAELLKSFVVELQRVDYSAEKRTWVAFEEKGTSESPFGPSGDRA